MDLKPNYLRVTASVYVGVAVFMCVVGVVAYANGKTVSFNSWLGELLLGGAVMSVAVSLLFVPREFDYDADHFYCRLPFREAYSHEWTELTAFGWGEGVFLLKFGDESTLQVSGCGFRRRHWREFLQMVKSRFPEKKCNLWFDLNP